jgi:hypothetical protein
MQSIVIGTREGKKMAKRLSFLFMAAILTAACSTTPARNNFESRQPLSPALADAGRNTAHLDLLPLLNVEHHSGDNAAPSPIGGYVRFYVEGSPPDSASGADRRRYGDEERNWFSRWLVGRTYSRVLTVKVAVQRPNVTGATTLASSAHESSNSAGETWSTEVNGRRYLTPYFRVDPSTVAGVEVNLSASSQIRGDVTKRILDVVRRGAALVGPTGSLVTTLNSQRLQSSADFIDQSISALFGEALAERTLNDFAPSEWTGDDMASIAASFPMGRRLANDDAARPIGEWKVHASTALVSIFADVPLHPPAEPAGGTDAQARIAFEGLAAHTVLGLTVAEHLSLGQALLADTSVTAAFNRLREAAAANQAEAALALCSAVSGKAEALGLNRYDAAAAVWAFARSAMSRVQADIVLSASTSCGAAALARTVGLG